MPGTSSIPSSIFPGNGSGNVPTSDFPGTSNVTGSGSGSNVSPTARSGLPSFSGSDFPGSIFSGVTPNSSGNLRVFPGTSNVIGGDVAVPIPEVAFFLQLLEGLFLGPVPIMDWKKLQSDETML